MTEDEAPAQAPAPAPPKGRSPNYPGISLPKAIERARQILTEAGQHQVPLKKIATIYWGYKAHTTGPASVTYAALKRYGLLIDEGTGDDRVARLTDLAIEILHPNPNQAEAIKRAALKPSINLEWWNQHGTDIPPDESLNWTYVVKGPFTANGLNDFLRVYRETIDFAKLTPSDSVEDTSPDRMEDEQHGEAPELDSVPPSRHVERRREAGVKTLDIPVRHDQSIIVEGAFPLEPAAWDQLMATLQVMKPTLVLEAATTAAADDEA